MKLSTRIAAFLIAMTPLVATAEDPWECHWYVDLIFDRAMRFTGYEYETLGQHYCSMDHLRIVVWKHSCYGSISCEANWENEHIAHNGNCNDLNYEDANQGFYNAYCN